jgi:hypothetical protein
MAFAIASQLNLKSVYSSVAAQFGFKGFMDKNKRLNPGESLVSENGNYRLVYQGDGNLVIYSPRRAIWQSKTAGRSPGFFAVQGDGNLVIYGKTGQVYWSSQSQNKGGDKLYMQGDGSLVLYTPQGKAVWNSGTFKKI